LNCNEEFVKLYIRLIQIALAIVEIVSSTSASTAPKGLVNNIRIVPKWQIVGSQSAKRQQNFNLSPNAPPRKATLLTEDGPLEVNGFQVI